MKKLVIYSTFVSPLRSGAEACAEEVAAELVDRFDITIIAARMKRSLPKKDAVKGVKVIRVGFGCSLDKWLYPIFAPKAARKLKPDIVHAVLESFAGMALVMSSRIRARKILTCQSTNVNHRKSDTIRIALGMMHKRADTVTVISNTLAERAKEFGRNDAVLIPNGLHVSDIPVREKMYGRVLFAGRLEPMKGIDTLLKAFVDLPPHIHLHIVGGGSLRQELEVQANMLGLHDRVTFKGFVPAPDVYEEFAEAQVFCGLSRREAFGNVFVEAQAAGCAVVATNIDGIPDTVTDGKTGILVSPDDPEVAAAAIRRMIDNSDERDAIVRAAKENASHYDWSDIAKRYAEVYQDD